MEIGDLEYSLRRSLKKLTYRYQGRYFRMTDVHGHVMHDLLA